MCNEEMITLRNKTTSLMSAFDPLLMTITAQYLGIPSAWAYRRVVNDCNKLALIDTRAKEPCRSTSDPIKSLE